MRISIVIPNYNGVKFLKVCLDSLYKQTFKAFDIIFIDNGSNDDSIELIKSNYPNVKLLTLEKNYGFSRAVNEGIRLSQSEYILLLNNDTEVEKNFLEKLLNCIENDNEIFSCSSKMLQFYDRTKIDDAGDEYNILGWAYKCGDGQTSNKYTKSREVFSSCAGAAIYRRKVFDEIGYFDENFFAYMEDVDISYRAKIHGYKNIYCNDAIVYHIGSATSGSKYNDFKVRLAARNNIYVAFKNMPLLQLILNSPFLTMGFAVKFIFFKYKGYGKVYWEGTKEGIRTVNKIGKTSYKHSNLKHYLRIEIELIINFFKYLADKIINL